MTAPAFVLGELPQGGGDGGSLPCLIIIIVVVAAARTRDSNGEHFFPGT